MVRWQWEWLSHGHASQTSKIQSHTAQLPWQSPPDPWTCSTGNTWLAETGYIVMSTCTKWIHLLSCSTQANYIYLKDVRPSDKFDNPYLILPWVTNDNSEHLCEPVSWTCFRVLCTLLYLHVHCPYITYYCFCCQSFIIILQKC